MHILIALLPKTRYSFEKNVVKKISFKSLTHGKMYCMISLSVEA